MTSEFPCLYSVDANFSVVGPKLQGKAQEIESTYAERHNAKSVQEIKEFMNKLQGLQTAHQFLRIRMSFGNWRWWRW